MSKVDFLNAVQRLPKHKRKFILDMASRKVTLCTSEDKKEKVFADLLANLKNIKQQ